MDLFQNLLPQDVLAKINLATLRLEKTNFIDNPIGKKAVDALFSVKFGEENGYLYLLAEHQSTIDKFMTLRLMKYMLMIVEHHKSNHPKDKYLAPVYPLVIYNGSDDYKAPNDFFELFRDKNLAKDLFMGPVQLINLPKISDEEILNFTVANLLMFMLKHINDEDIFSSISKIAHYLEITANRNFLYIESIFRYILNKGQTTKAADLVKLFTDITPDDRREDIMTIAEQLIQKGETQGIEKGRLEGKEEGKEEILNEVVINLYLAGQTIEFISKVTKTSLQKIQKIIGHIPRN
jgi:predicted transposase/invertase (TIGR01784 family)